MKPINRVERFKNAVGAIKGFLEQMDMPYGFETAPTTTNSWEKFKAGVVATNTIVVSEEGCDFTIYDSPRFNHLARYWHDRIHLDLDLDFTSNDESQVCEKQQEELELWMVENFFCIRTILDAKEIIYHDIVSQFEYYKETGEFVDDQKLFVFERFLR